MFENVDAEIITIGTEILLGEITDTNSTYLARVLRDIGMNLFYTTSVGDNRGRIADVIRLAMSRVHVVITCGGLGPTVDDMTRQSVADATNRELIFHQELLDQIAVRFASFKAQMTENNRRQAYLPENAIVIENPVGTAPAFIVEHEDRVIISLPGVPREMKYLMTECVIPYLRDKYQLGIIKARVLRTAGIGESMLDELIGNDLLEMNNPTIGLAAHNGQVDVRITAKADTVEVADAMIAEIEVQLHNRFGRYIFGYDQDVLNKVFEDTLKQYEGSLAIITVGIDDFIGTSIDKMILKSAAVFETPDDLRKAYQVNAAVHDLANQAVQRLATESGATVNMVIISAPDVNESADAQEATVVSIMVGEQNRSRAYGLGGQNPLVREWVSTWALASAWRMLKERFEGA
jgi:nicotinamide-nucleotide amidase